LVVKAKAKETRGIRIPMGFGEEERKKHALLPYFESVAPSPLGQKRKGRGKARKKAFGIKVPATSEFQKALRKKR